MFSPDKKSVNFSRVSCLNFFVLILFETNLSKAVLRLDWFVFKRVANKDFIV